MTAPVLATPPTADLAPPPGDVDGRVVATLRVLAADAVATTGAGHAGLPLRAAPAAWVLWSRFLRHDPSDPGWPDRDRFTLSAEHGSALLHALLHVTGYDLPLHEPHHFGQPVPATPRHAEQSPAPDAETTTAPLGQGRQGTRDAVGMALAERILAARCNRPGHTVVDHWTWVLAGGDLRAAISDEAAAVAGQVGLGRLVVVFDDDSPTVDGGSSACSDDVRTHLATCGWHTVLVDDGDDLDEIDAAFEEAMADESRPTLVALRSPVRYGTTVEGQGRLGPAALAQLKVRLGFDPDAGFVIPDVVQAAGAAVAVRGRAARVRWEAAAAAWRLAHPDLAAWDPARVDEAALARRTLDTRR